MAIAALLLALVFVTNPMQPGHLQWLRLFAVLLVAFFFLRAFVFGLVKNENPGKRKKNILTGLSGLAILFLLLEGIFMFVPKTIGSSQNLSSRLWFAWNWQPINSLGFRDQKPDTNKKFKLFFIGDSFTAGQGIDHPEDRFPDQFQVLAGKEISVNILADCDANTQTEFAYLQNYPIQPDEIILAWFVNDIEGAAAAEGLAYQPKLPFFDRQPFRLVFNHSYFLSFIYGIWPRTTDFGYGEFFAESWSNPEIVNRHFAEIDQFSDYATERKILFRVILFPRLRDLEGSQPYLSLVGQHLESQGIPNLNLSAAIAAYPENDRVVSRYDDHPSPLIHKVVAQVVYDWRRGL